MRNEQYRLDVIANNLANSATVGYKKEGVTSQSFDKQLMVKIRDASVDWRKEQIGRMSFGVKIGEVYTDYKQGPLREADRHGRHRVFRRHRRDTGLFLDQFLKPVKQAAASRQHNAPVSDICRKFRRCLLKHTVHRLDNL